jgi:Archaeal/vacuolar-type H+-ATPase subunit I
VKPERMSRVRLVAPRSRIRPVLDTLHSMKLLEIRKPEDEDLDEGMSLDDADTLSRKLVDIRSLMSSLPEEQRDEGSHTVEEALDAIPQILETVSDVEEKREEAQRQLENLKGDAEFFRAIRGTGLSAEDLEGTRNLDATAGVFQEDINGAEILRGEDLDVAVYEEEDVARELSASADRTVDIPQGYSGKPEQVLGDIRSREHELESRLEEVESELSKTSAKWMGSLREAEELLETRIEKSEAPLDFGLTDRAFFAEGWMPSDRVDEARTELEARLDGEVHLESESGTEDEPPVKHDNPGPVKPFEPLNDLLSVPKYNEVDPSFLILLTFPALFGFMIGDAGYGVTTFLMFAAGYKLFPAAKEIFVSLMFASFMTFLFGLAFGDAFGYIIFGGHSELAAATGIELFSQIPILFHRAEHLGQVFTIAGAFGVFHVNLGYLVGGYNEYIRHGLKEAFLEKGSWILLQIGVAIAVLASQPIGLGVIGLSIVLIVLGEGAVGVIEIPSLLSNIVSYLRVFGVSVAAVVLAKTVNALAEPLLGTGSLVLTVAGIGVLVVGHIFNTFIKIMEGFLQGIRLHYVEFYDKFYDGGGRRYVPFGAEDASL